MSAIRRNIVEIVEIGAINGLRADHRDRQRNIDKTLLPLSRRDYDFFGVVGESRSAQRIRRLTDRRGLSWRRGGNRANRGCGE